MTSSSRPSPSRTPLHLWLGLGLVAVFWPLNWLWPESWPGHDIRTMWGFFPLWLGYCLVVDGLVARRKGDSLLLRDPAAYVRLFVLSAPAWWLFEAFNARIGNWEYLGREQMVPWLRVMASTLSFSTVLPAVFGTAELAGTFGWLRGLGPGPRVRATPFVLRGAFAAGVVMLLLLLAWPRYFFPFVWLSVFFILEPINAWLGHRTLIARTARGDWRPVLALWVGVLICGFFWEMWNVYSYPKWIYHVPFVDVARIFEMPLLGYGGYLPFALELFALYHLATGLLGLRERRDYVRLVEEPGA